MFEDDGADEVDLAGQEEEKEAPQSSEDLAAKWAELAQSFS